MSSTVYSNGSYHAVINPTGILTLEGPSLRQQISLSPSGRNEFRNHLHHAFFSPKGLLIIEGRHTGGAVSLPPLIASTRTSTRPRTQFNPTSQVSLSPHTTSSSSSSRSGRSFWKNRERKNGAGSNDWTWSQEEPEWSETPSTTEFDSPWKDPEEIEEMRPSFQYRQPTTITPEGSITTPGTFFDAEQGSEKVVVGYEDAESLCDKCRSASVFDMRLAFEIALIAIIYHLIMVIYKIW